MSAYDIDYYVRVRISKRVNTEWYVDDNPHFDAADPDSFADWLERSGWLEEFDASQVSDVDGGSIDIYDCRPVVTEAAS